jgi:hypothetical protein
MRRYPDAVVAGRADRYMRRDLIWECVALRHQLAVLKRCQTRRACFRPIDRLFWIFLSWWWPGWREALSVVQADTVLRWRRDGITGFWKYRSRGRWRGGRPRIAVETRKLIRDMARANFLWGAPRIHGELLKLGITVSQASVSRYMPSFHGGQRSPTWRTFVRNQAAGIVRDRTFEAHGWIDSITSWLSAAWHRIATFAAAALAALPSWRWWCFAHSRGPITTRRRLRMARDRALNVASLAAAARRLTLSACKVDSLATARIRGPPDCTRAQSAPSPCHRSYGIRSACLEAATSRTSNAASSVWPSHAQKCGTSDRRSGPTRAGLHSKRPYHRSSTSMRLEF